MWIDPGQVDVAVENGVARLSGRLQLRRDVELLNKLAARVPGVVSVESTVTWDVDEATRKGRRDLERTVG
jgi:osmotically-inducible protein OsmY